LYGFFDDLTEFSKDFFFIGSVATAQDQSGTASDVTLILIRPFNDLDVPY
jgi:hypothetical protein